VGREGGRQGEKKKVKTLFGWGWYNHWAIGEGGEGEAGGGLWVTIGCCM